MIDKYGKVSGMKGMKDEELAEFNAVINDLIPKLEQIADKYNIDRVKMIKFTAWTLISISGPCSF